VVVMPGAQQVKGGEAALVNDNGLAVKEALSLALMKREASGRGQPAGGDGASP
jgi:hypothetical protein